MTHETKPGLGRRTFLKGVGVAGAGIGGLAAPVAAKGGKKPLIDRPVDVMIYWSSVGDDDDVDEATDDPNAPGEFGYPGPSDPLPPGGLFYVKPDPGDGAGNFDFGAIKMTPNGETLHNTWQLFHGVLMANKPKPYILRHDGGGRFSNRGQVMNFDAKPRDAIPPPLKRAPPIKLLAGERWRAVGTEMAQLVTDEDGTPTTHAEWGVTRVDFYSQGSGSPSYTLSLLFLIWHDSDLSGVGSIPPTVFSVGNDLITGGRLNLGGQ